MDLHRVSLDALMARLRAFDDPPEWPDRAFVRDIRYLAALSLPKGLSGIEQERVARRHGKRRRTITQWVWRVRNGLEPRCWQLTGSAWVSSGHGGSVLKGAVGVTLATPTTDNPANSADRQKDLR